MKKILMLTDFSEASRNALEVARSFFSDTIADFHLLCIHPEEAERYIPLYASETARTAYDDQLHDLVMELHQQATTDWHTFRSSVCPGQLFEIVEKAIQEEVYDFLVIGAKTDSTIELFGHDAIDLIRQLKTNLLVVPDTARPSPIRLIVLAADFANLKNSRLLSPLKEFVTLKGADLTLLTIDTPGKDIIHIERELHIRQFLNPIKPTVARLQAPDARQGIDAFLAGHLVDLLVIIPQHKDWADTLAGSIETHTGPYIPPVLLLTLYDDGSDDLSQPVDAVSKVNYAF